MDIFGSVPDVLGVLDALREARGMSYQNLTDACGISKSTVGRILNGQSEPTVQQLQMIAAAVQYKPATQAALPADYTQEAYITYLRASMQQQAEDNDHRVRQLQAHYNMLRRQDKREKIVWMVLAIIFMATFIVLFLYDLAHLDRGWIQAAYNGYHSTAHRVVLAVRDWVEGLPWIA